MVIIKRKYNTPHRSRIVKTRLSESEYTLFQERCMASGLSQSEYLREAAQKYFREHSIRRLPKIGDLNDEIASLVSEKNEYYNVRREASTKEEELRTIQANIETAIGKTLVSDAPERPKSQSRE